MDEQELSTVWISLDILDAGVDLDVITRRLGVKPSSYHRAGEARHKGKGRWPGDRWRVTVGPRETLNIEPMLVELMERVTSGDNVLTELCADLGATAAIKCTVLPGDIKPGMFFTADFMRWAGERGIPMEIDLIVGGDDLSLSCSTPPRIGTTNLHSRGMPRRKEYLFHEQHRIASRY